MGEVIAFPRNSERYWNEIWATLVEKYSSYAQGAEIIEGCKPEIRRHCDETWYSFSVEMTLPAHPELSAGVKDLVQSQGQVVANLIADKIEQQRVHQFLALADLEFRLAYALRFGKAP